MLKKIFQPKQKKFDRPYHLLQIESSMNCNLECVMCPWVDLHNSEKLLSWETFSHIQPYLNQAKEVDLTGGGEPLTNPYIPEMVKAVKAAGCKVGFSTNGLHLTPDVSETLIQLDMDWISFSFDAATPETYHRIRQGSSYETVIGNIRALKALKEEAGSQVPHVMMVFVMMSGEHKNFHELPAYIDLAHSLGAEYIIAKNLDVIVKDGDFERGLFSHAGTHLPEVVAVRQQAEKRAKELGISLRLYNLEPRQQTICEQHPVHNLYINYAGNVSPCITLSYADNRVFNGERVHVPCLVYGNVHDEPLETIWNKADYDAFRKLYERRLSVEQEAMLQAILGGDESEYSLPDAPEGCRTCYYLYGI